MRLEILQKSLEKKKEKMQRAIDNVFAHQAMTNGQPMNDKSSGVAWFNKRDRLDDAAINARAEIEKTERAIEREMSKIRDVDSSKETLPKCIIDAIESGKIVQWRRFPRFFFVAGVEKARIAYNEATAKKPHYLSHLYVKEIPNDEQYQIFRDVFNDLSKKLKDSCEVYFGEKI